jgi:GT2 family glycosyltransferase
MPNYKTKVAVILLNYNSEDDLFVSTDQISKQLNVDLFTIIVDNASCRDSRERIQFWVENKKTTFFSGSVTEALYAVKDNSNSLRNYMIYNHENRGYSAGNNIGIRLADALDVDVVLIANPDMRFNDANYIFKLTLALYSDRRNAIAASKIVGLDGKDQNPLRESSFWEELLWPKTMLLRWFKNFNYIVPYKNNQEVSVDRVSGCCLLLRMSFLKEIGYFDENVFLYCEEPILASQIKQKDRRIVFTPFTQAVHAHCSSLKGNSSRRMLLFFKSRHYYLKNYSGYNWMQLLLLKFSYSILKAVHIVKAKIGK